MSKGYEIATYYFPNYHPDERNAKWHGSGWTEWDLVKYATPRFRGHKQPKVPLWGYEDESKPEVFEKKIDAAADHGIDAFIFDWYWYEDGPYLQKALENGYMGAGNNDRVKFTVMWANHNWMDLHPAQRSRPFNVLAKGAVSSKAFVKATDHMIDKYFSHASYWRTEGKLFVSIYDLSCLIQGLGSIDDTRKELDNFRKRVQKAGLGEINLNAIIRGKQILPGERESKNQEVLNKLGFDSIMSYVWIHHHAMADFPLTSYSDIRKLSVEDHKTFSTKYNLSCYPNVTMGWDPSPRTIQSDVYDNLGYPFTPILGGNTPEEFKVALLQAKDHLDKGNMEPKILTINAWNEWTEGSYLEPDRVNGFKYLEAIRDVFVK